MKWWTMLCRAIQDRWFMVESSDKTWSTGEGMANHFSILALRQHGNKFGELSSNLRIHRRTIQKRSSWPRVSGMITHLEPDILECKVKWALGSITSNKVSGSDTIPAVPFQILKDDAIEVVHSLLLLLSHFSPVRLCVTPQMAAQQAPPSLGFSRQEHWSGLPFPSPMHEGEKRKWSRSIMSDSSQPHELQSTRLLCPWDFPGKSTGVGCHHLIIS